MESHRREFDGNRDVIKHLNMYKLVVDLKNAYIKPVTRSSKQVNILKIDNNITAVLTSSGGPQMHPG